MATNLRPIADTPPTNAFRSGLKWLYPGMRVKRYLLLIPIGLIPVTIGVLMIIQLGAVDLLDRLDHIVTTTLGWRLDRPAVHIPLGFSLIVLGLMLIVGALVLVNRTVVSVIAPEHLGELPEVIHRKVALSQGARIVALGGGTGLSTLLRGLKKYTSNLTAVVTMTDDGGSSGLLQKQLAGGMLPPGDIRNCLVALADAEPLMQDLFQFRFSTKEEGDGLSGHSFGNLLIAAMSEVTGDFETAVEATSNILAIRGRVLPSTTDSVVLVGEMADGREITGETNIAHDDAAIRRITLCPADPRPLPEVIEAIRQAEIIVMGPGSVYTSVIPNLLVREIAQAVAASKALRVYVCNVMTQPGETDHFSASDHVQAIEEHAAPFLTPKQRIFDYVLVNTTRPGEALMERYTRSGAEFVTPDADIIAGKGYKAVRGSFLSESAVVRHDPDKISRAILRLFAERPLFGK
ncbi:MAG: YvcK family protein [Capsulimonadales bacterium]|nr:YvcK family protein [Capsulimonadales bacterium]